MMMRICEKGGSGEDGLRPFAIFLIWSETTFEVTQICQPRSCRARPNVVQKLDTGRKMGMEAKNTMMVKAGQRLI